MPSQIEQRVFHGIPAIYLQTASGAEATVSLLGGQVLSWIPRGGKERLYLSEQAVFDGSRSIRGGVPVCFPQFSGLGDLPKHGFLRTVLWQLTDQRVDKDFVWASLTVSDTEASRAIWPFAFTAELTVGIEAEHLTVELEITNTGTQSFDFTAALHSYLRVSEAEAISIKGLYGLEYRDAAKGDRIVRESAPEVVVEDELDRVYHQAKRPVLLDDGQRRLGIEQTGFPDVVVWNPWEHLCRQLPDMPDADFRRMICIEAAVAQHPMTLPAGESWWGRQMFSDNPEPVASLTGMLDDLEDQLGDAAEVAQ